MQSQACLSYAEARTDGAVRAEGMPQHSLCRVATEEKELKALARSENVAPLVPVWRLDG